CTGRGTARFARLLLVALFFGLGVFANTATNGRRSGGTGAISIGLFRGSRSRAVARRRCRGIGALAHGALFFRAFGGHHGGVALALAQLLFLAAHCSLLAH